LQWSGTRVYRTDYLPDASLLLTIPYEQFEQQFDRITNILSPDSILRTWHDVSIDTGKPLAPGLGSIARIAAGTFQYTSLNTVGSSLEELLFNVTGGAFQRDDDDRIIAYVITQSPLASAQELNARLGNDRMELVTDETSISTDPDRPTIFRSSQQLVIPIGSQALGFTFPETYVVDTATMVQGYLIGSEFRGTFQFVMEYDKPLEVEGVTLRTITGAGSFHIYVV
jgi:hypothetical protein